MLHACCGQAIAPGQAELLDGHKGMPCVTCIVLSPAEGDMQQVNGTDLLGIARPAPACYWGTRDCAKQVLTRVLTG